MRSKFKKDWTIDSVPFTFSEMLFNGDVLVRKKILGHSYGRHYLRNINQSLTFYINKKTENEVKIIGYKKYQDHNYIIKYIATTKKIEKEVFKIANYIKKLRLINLNNRRLFRLFKDFFDSYTKLLAVYRFTRPEVYQKLIDKIILEIPQNKKKA